ncbi:glycoside hydrolase family 97 catalytic domain-containing protein [Luteolibacter yonseiensis]|uniref:Glycoside hydrolase family 97 catalytic domain-containing protein n=1 Tax=Luteolibacter yonseiensis TaxID=1144680 RepID=A0A934VCA6_9BACT|nr:glycoside hydrolase family 97 catalytic domain-containing protein [Luteolibacter yonseiensis]MBK1816771.1 glycoside hydrolase family 97 catalytic domain-containing protein [Luteolibacter yonseiensis]
MNPFNPSRLTLSLLALCPLASLSAKEIWLDEYDTSGFSTGFGDAKKNKSISNKPLSIAGTTYPRGMGVHAPSDAFVNLRGQKSVRFQATVGADDGPEQSGSVVFQVIGDGKKLYDSGTLRKGDAAKKVDVDLAGVKLVELRVTDAGDGKNSDHANWADARFIYSDEAPAMGPRWTVSLPHYEGDVAKLAAARPQRVISSPDKKVKAGISVADGRLVIQVLRNGRPVLAPSPLGVTVDAVDLGKDVEIGGAQPYKTDETYAWFGNTTSMHDLCNGEKVSIRSGGETWTLDWRAYGDGIAWRYIIPGGGKRKVTGEATSFVIPEGASYWSNHNTGNYEANFLHFTVKDDSPTRQITMPVTVELKDGGYASITEANMFGYSGMTLGPRGRTLNGIFEDDAEGWTMEGEIATPWRIVIAAEDLNGLVNQSIVYNVSPPPDAKRFPQGMKTDWLKPGRSYWTWGFGQWDTAKWELIKGFVDDAASLNCDYYVIDDPWREPKMGWHRNGRDEWASLREVCDYAATKKVKIMVWEHWERLKSLEKREEFFKNVAAAGAVGVKIDFMDSESQDRLAFFKSCLEIGAKEKILINFHGANKPAGEERTWPHWMTREAVFGMEQGGNVARSHLAALPFTRLVTGPADFTPTVFRDGPMGKTTAGSQMAAAVAYNSPLNHWADSAKSYLAQPAEVVDFIRTKPVVWDELRVLPGSRIGEIAALARRSGDSWWIAVINGTDQVKTYDFVLDFLPSGNFHAVSFSDVEGEKTRLEIGGREVKSGDKATARMSPGGGFVMILKKN